ncbi:MAG: hypothetical protein ACRD2T_04400, partial [Thermoanaerobaculia bacterium]
PYNARHRTFLLAELDRLSNNKEDLHSQNNRTNTYVRLGYQIGTPEDARSNAIVGETRARQERLFTAFRDLGPGNFGLTGALTYGFDVGWGDFVYAKAEFEALKRLNVTPRTFVIGRLHGGSFLHKQVVARGEDLLFFERYSIPLSEFFRLDVYFPEGDLDFRLSRLVNKVFFEGQVKYNFIDGDISAFLRYRYYGLQRTLQFAVFDAIEFPDIEDFTDDFDRVRGLLVLMQWPRDVHHRVFALAELDRVSTNKESLESQNNRTNTFLRVGYQIGTPGDSRSNAIVGETRARSERLFTAFREVGPGNAGFTGAVTWGFDAGWGDFDYVKLEFETLKRFDVT